MISYICRIIKFQSKEKEEDIMNQYKRSELCPDYLFLEVTHLVILQEKHQLEYAPVSLPIGNSVGHFLDQ